MNRAPRSYRLDHEEIDALIETLVERASREYGSGGNADLVREIVVTSLRLLKDSTPRGDVRLINSALKEMRYALKVFKNYEHVRKVSVFGSARTQPNEPEWQQAFRFAEKIVGKGWMVITGAGDGIMGAAQGGAGREKSFGVNIRLPFEQVANKTIAGDPKLINFRYFFTRKLMFLKESHAVVLFPGGFGTHDEGFETLTLIQTGKSEFVPVVFIDRPGGSYWKEWQSYIEKHLKDAGLVNPEDLALFKVTDDVDDAIEELQRFYRNYHSSRYVLRQLVLRVRQVPGEEELERLNKDFADILTGGRIETRGPLPEENGDLPDLMRVVVPFNRRDNGRVRQLIDRLNALVPRRELEPVGASPHVIVPQELPPQAEETERLG